MTSPHPSGEPAAPQPSPAQRITVWHAAVTVLIFFAIAWVIHHDGFHAPMIYDSKEWINHKAHVFDRHDPLEVISIVPVRPLFMLSLYANYLLTGMDPAPFRFVNCAMLAVSGLALVLLAIFILETPQLGVPGTCLEKRITSLYLGLYFVVHPLQTFVVLYVWQREAIMASCWYLFALAVYVGVRGGRFRRQVPWYALTAILFLAGILTKENVATLPIALVLIELTVFRQGLRQAAGRALIIAAVALPLFAVYFFLTQSLHGGESVHPQGILGRLYDHYASSGLTFTQVALTESRVVFSYVAMILAPFWSGIVLVRPMVVSTALWNPPVTAAAGAGVAGLIGAGLGLVRKRPLIAFGILFFFVTVAPESLLIPTYLFFGYRPILPMAGVLLPVGELVLAFLRFSQRRMTKSVSRLAVPVALLVPVACMALMTFGQAQRWKPLLFWQDAYAHVPTLSENVEVIPYLDVVTSLSGELLQAGAYGAAIRVLSPMCDFILRSDRATSPPQPSKGAETVDEHPGNALSRQRIVFKRAGAVINLGRALHKSGDLAGAIDQYKRALEIDPQSAIVYNNLALVLEDAGDRAAAERNYRRAIEIAPKFPGAYYGLGNLLLKDGNLTDAIGNLQRAVELRPDYAEARANLGAALLSAGRAEEAIVHLRQALVLLDRNAELYNVLGVAYAEKGRVAEARDSFRKALALEPTHGGARQNLNDLLKRTAPSPR